MKHKLRNAIILTSVCVGSLHIINQFISSAATVKNLLPIRPGKYFDWRHGRVYYRKFGSGKPLLLIHDLDPSASAYEWNQLSSSWQRILRSILSTCPAVADLINPT